MEISTLSFEYSKRYPWYYTLLLFTLFTYWFVCDQSNILSTSIYLKLGPLCAIVEDRIDSNDHLGKGTTDTFLSRQLKLQFYSEYYIGLLKWTLQELTELKCRKGERPHRKILVVLVTSWLCKLRT